jgi:cellulose biosynthesis protein BcsQ
MRIVAFLSQKGGCGKTTSCLNIAALMARERGYRVLLVDLDSNACASRTLEAVVSLPQSVGAALLGERSLASVLRDSVVERLSLAPGSTDLSLIESCAVSDRARMKTDGRLREDVLGQELAGVQGLFDYVFLDCPGGHPFMQHSALLACDDVVIPTGLSVYDLYATTPTVQLVTAAQRARNRQGPNFLGLLPNGAGKAGITRKVQSLLDEIPEVCLTPVRHSALLKTIATAPKVEQRILAIARPEHPVSATYRQVAREIEVGLEAARPLPGAGP